MQTGSQLRKKENEMNKYLIIAILAIIGYGFLPISIPKFGNQTSESELRIERQECGCPCPNSRIVEGELEISEEWIKNYPQLKDNKSEINITSNSNHKSIKWFCDLHGETSYFVEGEIIGIDTILCNPENCEIAPRFEVKKIRLNSYVPQFWMFKRYYFFGYWIFTIIGIFVLVNIGITKMNKLKK